MSKVLHTPPIICSCLNGKSVFFKTPLYSFFFSLFLSLLLFYLTMNASVHTIEGKRILCTADVRGMLLDDGQGKML